MSKLRLMESLAVLSARSSAGTRRPYANTHRNARLAARRAGVHHSRRSSPSSGKLAGNLLGWGDCFLIKRGLFSLWKSLSLHEYCAIGGEWRPSWAKLRGGYGRPPPLPPAATPPATYPPISMKTSGVSTSIAWVASKQTVNNSFCGKSVVLKSGWLRFQL